MNSLDLISKGFFWKLLERLSVQTTQFMIQIILARLISPEHYGALTIMLIIVNIANIIIQNGFNIALIQDKEVNDEDFSSVFWLVLSLSVFVYCILFFGAPFFSSYYNMPYLKNPFRVICLVLIPGALNSIQIAFIRRDMDFKKEFTSNLISIVISGCSGIILAIYGFGLWALVAQTLLNASIASITMGAVVGWRPKLVFNYRRVRKLFAFGHKLVLAGLLDSISNDLSGLIIGVKYNSVSLGYYTRGKQFPSAVMGSLNSTVQSVMLPALSAIQDDKEKAKRIMRKSMVLSAFFIFPMMAGLAGIARPMVQLVLTEKWIECVPYIQIFCFCYAFWPVHTSNLQAINALGRSDIFLNLEIYKKVMGFSSLAFAVYYFDTPVAIAGIGMFTTLISCFINSYPNKYLLNYSYIEQMKDIIPYFMLSLCMFFVLIFIDGIVEDAIYTVFFQFLFAIIFYWSASHILRLDAYIEMYRKIKVLIQK